MSYIFRGIGSENGNTIYGTLKEKDNFVSLSINQVTGYKSYPEILNIECVYTYANN